MVETTIKRAVPKLAIPVKFKRLHKDAVIPEYKTAGAACVDLVITDIEYIDDYRVLVKYGFATEFSDAYKVLIFPRSSQGHKGWVIAHNPGIIDADYRGEWMTKFDAIPVGVKDGLLVYEQFPFKVGERATQCSIEVNMHMKFREADELSVTVRGEGGFGHTGK